MFNCHFPFVIYCNIIARLLKNQDIFKMLIEKKHTLK